MENSPESAKLSDSSHTEILLYSPISDSQASSVHLPCHFYYRKGQKNYRPDVSCLFRWIGYWEDVRRVGRCQSSIHGSCCCQLFWVSNIYSPQPLFKQGSIQAHRTLLLYCLYTFTQWSKKLRFMTFFKCCLVFVQTSFNPHTSMCVYMRFSLQIFETATWTEYIC